MKTKRALLFFLFLSMFTLGMINARAQTYSLGVEKNDEFIFEMTVVDKDGLEAVLGSDWAQDVNSMGFVPIEGAKEKIIITGIKEETYYWQITVQRWEWTVSDFEEYPDDTTYYLYVIKDPAYGYINTYICPIPVESYLLLWDVYDDVEVEDTTITVDISYLNMDIAITYSSDTGVVSTYKWLYVGKTILEFSEYSPFQIPGYELPILLGVTAISTLGLIYIIMKKK